MNTVELIFWICLGIVFYTYIGYGILLYLLVKVKEHFVPRKPKEDIFEDDLPTVTMIVAAYNEEDIIEEKIKNTLALNYPPERLLLTWITDGSTDRTNEILAKYPMIEVLYQPERQGKAAALNRAMCYVDTELTIFSDANTMLGLDSIRKIVACFTDEYVGVVSGEKRVVGGENAGAAGEGEGLYWKYESAMKDLDSRLWSTMGAAGELFALRTELYDPLEWDTLLDDFIVSMRIVARGFRIEYCPEAYAVETGSANMEEEQKRKVRIAAGGLQSIWRLPQMLNFFSHGVATFQYLSHRVFRWSIAPLSLFALLPLNLLALIFSQGWSTVLYGIILICQLLFYYMGYRGYKLSQQKIKNKWLYVPYYFLFMNLNVIRGFSYLRKKRGSGVWEKAKRA